MQIHFGTIIKVQKRSAIDELVKKYNSVKVVNKARVLQ